MDNTDIEKCNTYANVITSLNELKNKLDELVSLVKDRKKISHLTEPLSELYTTISFDNCLIPYDLLVAIKDLVNYSERTLRKRFEEANSPQELYYHLTFESIL